MSQHRIIPIFVPHLGCPSACVFCNQRRISGVVSQSSPEQVRLELEQGLAKLEGQTAQAAFYGGSFTAIDSRLQEQLLQVAYDFLLRGRLSGIRLSTRPDAIDDEVISRLRRYGVDTVELGCQSLDDRVLQKTKRGHDSQCCIRATESLKAAGFNVILQMMTGLPGDDGSQSLQTAEKIISLRPNGVRIYPTVVVKNTELYDDWLSGKYQEHTVEQAVELCATLYEMFDSANIPIIRLGLNPTEELSSGAAAAGAYHPALGELVRSRVYLRRMTELLQGQTNPDTVTFMVPKGAVSLTVGHKRCNITALKEGFMLKSIKIKEYQGAKGDIYLQF